jgi:hypothetical protein
MFLLPKIAEAASSDAVNSIVSRIVDNIVTPLLELLFFLTLVIFVWGLFGFFKGGEDTEARKKGQQHILWGVVGMFIMVSVYGILRLVAATVGQSGELPF